MQCNYALASEFFMKGAALVLVAWAALFRDLLRFEYHSMLSERVQPSDCQPFSPAIEVGNDCELTNRVFAKSKVLMPRG